METAAFFASRLLELSRARVCISPAPQSPSPKLETTRSLKKCNQTALRLYMHLRKQFSRGFLDIFLVKIPRLKGVIEMGKPWKEDSMKWKWGGLKRRNNSSRTEYKIFLKEKSPSNVGNWKVRRTFRTLDFLRIFEAVSGSEQWSKL